MHRFEIYANEELIGRTEFEGGDPPMGVASGVLFPALGYAAFQDRFISADGGEVPGVRLSVRLSGAGIIGCAGGVCITDYSADLGAEGLQVAALGIAYPQYQELFPGHVAAYEAQFQ